MSSLKNNKRLFDEVRDFMRLKHFVMTRDEVRTILDIMDGVPQIIAKLLYGCGLRIMETVRLRVQNIMQFYHYSIHTEKSYCEWIKKLQKQYFPISNQAHFVPHFCFFILYECSAADIRINLKKSKKEF